MARISNQSAYPAVAPQADDYLIGTDESQSFVTKTFALADISTFIKSGLNLGVTPVLTAADTTNQVPSAIDTPLQVKFGSAQGTVSDPVSLDASGTITFNDAGLYLFNGFANFERQGSSGGVAVILFRVLINDVQSGVTKMVELDQVGLSIPYEVTFPLSMSQGDTLKYQILQDSTGVSEGGLYTHVNGSSWDDVPSTAINIFKVGI